MLNKLASKCSKYLLKLSLALAYWSNENRWIKDNLTIAEFVVEKDKTNE